MALSDYLTGDEWDGCFYASFGQHQAENLDASMHKTIQHLLQKGYSFTGLDGQGNKRVQVGNGINAPKLVMFFGNSYKLDPGELLDNGRNFLKQHAPELVDETDQEWAEQMAKAKEKKGK